MSAQDNEANTIELASDKLDRAEWKEMVDETDYWRGKKKKKDKKERDKEFKEKNQMQEMDLSFLQYLMIGAAIALIVFLLLKVFAAELFTSSTKLSNNTNFKLEDIESNLTEAPLQKLLREAIEAKHYKLAVRVYYLIILQSLNEKKLIKWHKEKTDTHYLNEMRSNDKFREFKIVTQVFEHVWYGSEEEISQIEFQHIQPAFNDFIKIIEQK